MHFNWNLQLLLLILHSDTSIINTTTKFAQCWYKTVPSCAQCWPRETAVQQGWSLAPETQSSQEIRGVVKVQHAKLTIVHGGCIHIYYVSCTYVLARVCFSLSHTLQTLHTPHTTHAPHTPQPHTTHSRHTHHASVLYQNWLFISPASHRSHLFTRLLQIST